MYGVYLPLLASVGCGCCRESLPDLVHFEDWAIPTHHTSGVPQKTTHLKRPKELLLHFSTVRTFICITHTHSVVSIHLYSYIPGLGVWIPQDGCDPVQLDRLVFRGAVYTRDPTDLHDRWDVQTHSRSDRHLRWWWRMTRCHETSTQHLIISLRHQWDYTES